MRFWHLLTVNNLIESQMLHQIATYNATSNQLVIKEELTNQLLRLN